MSEVTIKVDAEEVKDAYDAIIEEQLTDDEMIEVYSTFFTVALMLADDLGAEGVNMPFMVTTDHVVH